MDTRTTRQDTMLLPLQHTSRKNTQAHAMHQLVLLGNEILTHTPNLPLVALTLPVVFSLRVYAPARCVPPRAFFQLTEKTSCCNRRARCHSRSQITFITIKNNT